MGVWRSCKCGTVEIMRQFLRGERHKLADFAPLHRVWEVELSLDAPLFVVDYCCLGLDANGRPVDDSYLIFYNRPDAPYGAIAMDNVSNTGALFTIDVARLPANVRRLVFTATLQSRENNAGAFNISGNGILSDIFHAAFGDVGITPDIGEGYVALRAGTIDAGYFPFSGRDFHDEQTLVIGEIYWKDDWRFVGVGQGLGGDLSAFLRHLGDGSVAANPAQPAIPPAKVLAAPTALAPAPKTPVAAPAPSAPRIVPPQPSPPVAKRPDVPHSVPPGGKLQDLIDAAAPHSSLTLLRGEYQGPIVINKPLSLSGQDSAIWARQGPVVTVAAPDVSLRDFQIEITVPERVSGEGDIALKIVGSAPQLQDVRVRGRISGLPDAGGEWILPPALDLGRFAARADNQWKWELRVPTAIQLSSSVEGLSLAPEKMEAGTHQITLTLRDVAPDALVAGQIEVRSASLTRTIPLSGSAANGLEVARGIELWRVSDSS